VSSFCILSAIPGNIVVPPERTTFPYKSFLMSTLIDELTEYLGPLGFLFLALDRSLTVFVAQFPASRVSRMFNIRESL